MRVYALYILVAFLVVYAWRDWFKSLCGLILLMAVIEHEDMPKSIFGIQGFNPWNILLLGIVLAWLASRRREKLRWDMPRSLNVLLLLYLATIVIGFLRAVFDRSHIEHIPLKGLISEELINTIKWIIPALLLFDGCRSRKRLVIALTCLLGMYFVLSLQLTRRMPWESALGGGGDYMQRIRLKTCQSIGYSACDMSAMLAGASWAILATAFVFRRRLPRFLMIAAAGITAFGQALTGGRAGYLAWGVTGLVLCLIKWRKWLILAPVVPFVLIAVFPGAAERAFAGFGQTDVSGETVTDDRLLTSDRTLFWPHVLERISQRPLIGYGRLAMMRSGLSQDIGSRYGEEMAVSHPHNIYLEWLLDNGIIGFGIVIALFALVLWRAGKLFRAADPWTSAVGGIGLSLVLAQLFAGIGSQHFYPGESTLGMWVAIFLVLRTSVELQKARRNGLPVAPGKQAVRSAGRSQVASFSSIRVS